MATATATNAITSARVYIGMKTDFAGNAAIAIGIGVASLIGFVILGLGLRNVYRGLASTSWPTVAGVVIKSVSTYEVSRSGSGVNRQASAVYSPTTIVRYHVGNTDYETGTRQFGQFEGSGDESFAAIETRRFPVGKMCGCRTILRIQRSRQ